MIRRIAISTALGAIFGAICLYGTMTSLPGQLSTPILATIFYNRVLLGLVIGMAGSVPLHPMLRGAALGLAVSLEIALPSGFQGGALLLGAGAIYGIVTDLLATRLQGA